MIKKYCENEKVFIGLRYIYYLLKELFIKVFGIAIESSIMKIKYTSIMPCS
jgi:hypothetical protein